MSTTVKIDIRQLPHGEGLPLPAYQSAYAAGLDLLAAVPEDAPIVLAPGKYATGAHWTDDRACRRALRPRSGRVRALRPSMAITVLNSPGTVDADYRGEISACS